MSSVTRMPEMRRERREFLVAGYAAFGVILLCQLIQGISLPYDALFNTVVYLMWSGTSTDGPYVAVPLLGLKFAALFLAFVSLLSALFVGRSVPAWWGRMSQTARRSALLVALFVLVSNTLSRVVANVVYAATAHSVHDVTPWISHLEAPLLEALQRSWASPTAGVLFARVYSTLWLPAIILPGPILAVAARRAAATQILVGSVLVAVLAVPFFVLFPVFDPWAMNPLYGYAGPGLTSIEYLYPHASVDVLHRIATEFRWATGSCLPSLHVAFPALIAFVAYRNRLRLVAAAFFVLVGVTAAAILYLGRHWIVDIVTAVPYSYGIAWLADRWCSRYLAVSQDAPLQL